MSEENPSTGIPRKRVDFSPYTYQRLLRNLKHVWSNIEYDSWQYYAKRQGYTDEQIKDGELKFQELKRSIETKIDLLLQRVEVMIKNAEKGEVDYDYPITCHSVGAGFMLEEHLKHLQPAVAFSKVFTDPRDVKQKYR